MKSPCRVSTTLRAYAEMAEMTRRDCDLTCKDPRPYRCCEVYYCDLAIHYALTLGEEISSTAHPTLPLMDPVTFHCTAPAHLRPVCSAHHCAVNSAGMMATPAETARYFRLRNRAGMP